MSGTAGSGYVESGNAAVVKAECDVEGFYVKRVTIAADDEDDIAIIAAKPQKKAGGDDIRIEQALSLVTGGQEVKITGDAGAGTMQALFHGRAMAIHVTGQGRFEEIEVTVLGLKHELKTEKLFGCWSRDSADTAQHLQALPLVFNPDLYPNKNKADLPDPGGRKRACFNHDKGSEDVELWTGASASRYCATAERKDDVSSAIPRVFPITAQVGGELAAFKISDVNVEGEDIWSALVRIAHQCSHSIVFRYGATRQASTLRYFPRTKEENSGAKQFEFPAVGDLLDEIDRAKILDSVDFHHDFSGIVSQWDAVCPPKLWDSRFELIAGWTRDDEDACLEGADNPAKLSKFLRETDPKTSTDWERFKYVGRRYILNETGRDENIWGSEEPYDFSSLFGIEKYAERFRPFRRDRAELDETDQPLPPQLIVTWGGSMPVDIMLGDDAVLLEDRAGVYFRGRPLINPASYLETGTASDLFPTTVEIKAAVEGDQSAPFGVIASSQRDSALPTFGIVRLDDGLRVDNVNPEKVADADAAAQKLVDQAAAELGHRREVGVATCPYISNRFAVGDYVDNIDGRDMALKSVIMKITWDFMTQSTEYALGDPMLETETRSPAKSSMQGAGVDARSDEDTRKLADLVGHASLGHPVQKQLGEALHRFSDYVKGAPK